MTETEVKRRRLERDGIVIEPHNWWTPFNAIIHFVGKNHICGMRLPMSIVHSLKLKNKEKILVGLQMSDEWEIFETSFYHHNRITRVPIPKPIVKFLKLEHKQKVSCIIRRKDETES